MSHDPLNLDAIEDAQAQEAKRNQLAIQNEEDDLKWLMSSKRGRRIVRRMLEGAGVYRSSFNTNALHMAFLEGSRNQGLILVAKLMASAPDQYSAMLKEKLDV